MLSEDERDGGYGDVPIRDAACLILVDRADAAARMLMGRRRSSQIFLPNKWVFPGGRVDDDDRRLANTLCRDALPDVAQRHAFALAAVRETFEETGLLLQSAERGLVDPPSGWQAFARCGGAPDIARLTPVARAVTPPGRPRRFDTWFFMADWIPGENQAREPDGELLDLNWFTLDGARGLDLPIITRQIVDDVATLLGEDAREAPQRIPFYFQDKDRYRREYIDV